MPCPTPKRLSAPPSIIPCTRHASAAKIDGVEASLREEDVTQTLRVLLKHGFEPNERCEDPGLRRDLDSAYGFAPLQILERVALRAQRAGICEVYSIAKRRANLLASHGARVYLRSPRMQAEEDCAGPLNGAGKLRPAGNF